MRLADKKNIDRLVIYFFYDADGIVDRYVPCILEDIRKNCSELLVVCNGKLTPEGRQIFEELTPNLLVRENEGFDVWAYKTGLEHYGWEKLAKFDEVIMMNHTIMGPVCPFSEMFEEMDRRDLDFWGITKFHRIGTGRLEPEKGNIPEHIQSHFIAVRNHMLTSADFAAYWEARPPITSYDEAVKKHEAIFTKTFSDKGFVWGCYADTTDLEAYTHYPLLMTPVKVLREYRCPVFKRRSFFHNYSDYLAYGDGDPASELLEYLKTETSYDVSMIWENIIRTANMADIRKAVHLNFVLPVSAGEKKAELRTALGMHIYFADSIDYCYRYALSMPDGCDVYITTPTEENAERIREVFSTGPWDRLTVMTIENRGRDVSSLCVAIAPYLSEYDCVCFAHDKKAGQLKYGLEGYAFSERCFQNLLGSRGLVQNILAKFQEEPFLGLLCPPPPNFSEYYITQGCEWGPNYPIAEELYQKLELKCPMDPGKEPVAPLGTMFWFRPAALKILFEYGWEYTDFPKEPNKIDGTILHAIERIYPFVAQECGYYSAWVLSDRWIQLEWTNLSHMLREVNTYSFELFGLGTLSMLTGAIGKCIAEGAPGMPSAKRIRLKRKIKKIIPKPIWAVMKRIYHFFGGEKWVG